MSRRLAIFRSYAAECLALADKAADASDREKLLDMAAGWHELATLLQAYMDDHDGEEFRVSEMDLPGPRH